MRAETDEEELRRQLGDIRRSLRVRMATRHLGAPTVLSRRDGRAFTRILRQHHPRLLFLENFCQSPYRHAFIPSLDYARGSVHAFVPEDDVDAARLVDEKGRLIGFLPRLSFEVSLSEVYLPGRPFHEVRYGKPESNPRRFHEGTVRTRHAVNDSEHKQFMRGILSLLRRIASRTLWEVDRATGEARPEGRPSRFWCGFDAMQWCSEDPRRRLVYD